MTEQQRLLADAQSALRLARGYMYREYGTGNWEAELKADQDYVDTVIARLTEAGSK